ncbi:phosphatidylserine decarboxylase [bacterium]|nr:phosphatidylserine decarboxylase [bacterium]
MFAPEGLPFLVVPAIVFFLFALAGVIWKKKYWFAFSGVALLFWIAMLVFFRDPVRVLPEPDTIVAPSDGHVVEIETLPNGATRIAVFLSLLDVHAIRAPIAGEVTGYEFVPGSFLRADDPEAGKRNQHARLDIESEHGLVQMRAISGAVARRVLVHPRPGDLVEPGQRIGFVRFGSRCEITLPSSLKPEVAIGQEVFGGVTILALPYEPAVEKQEGELLLEADGA